MFFLFRSINVRISDARSRIRIIIIFCVLPQFSYAGGGFLKKRRRDGCAPLRVINCWGFRGRVYDNYTVKFFRLYMGDIDLLSVLQYYKDNANILCSGFSFMKFLTFVKNRYIAKTCLSKRFSIEIILENLYIIILMVLKATIDNYPNSIYIHTYTY